MEKHIYVACRHYEFAQPTRNYHHVLANKRKVKNSETNISTLILVALSTTLVEYSGGIVIFHDRSATHLPSWKPRYVLIDRRCLAVPGWQSLSIPISITGDLLPGWPNNYRMASRRNKSVKQKENDMEHGHEPKPLAILNEQKTNLITGR